MGQQPCLEKNQVSETLTTIHLNTLLGDEGPTYGRPMTSRSESREEAAGSTSLLTHRNKLRIAAWNVRAMYETGRTVQIARKMKAYNIGLLGLSETRWLQSGQLRLASGETLLYSGHTEEDAHHTEGAALMLTPVAQKALIGWKPISPRIVWFQFNLIMKHLL